MDPVRPQAPASLPTAGGPDGECDESLIAWMLSLTPDERLDVLQGFADSVAELTDGALIRISEQAKK